MVGENETKRLRNENKNGCCSDGGGSFLRSVCIDYLHYNEDGSMKRMVQTAGGVLAAR